jgi:methyl-accepting chemotaxis protein
MNTSVRGKLIAGFGAVLLLTALLTCIALYSVQQLTIRSEALVDSISLDSQIAAVRLQENEFDRTGQSQAVDAYNREIGKLDTLVDKVRISAGEDGRGAVERIRSVRKTYEQTFSDFVVARNQARRAQSEMNPVIEDIASKLNKVLNSLFETLGSNPASGIAPLQTAVELQGLMSALRDEVRNYIANPTDQAHQHVAASVDHIRQRGNDLWELLPSDDLQQQLVDALQAVLTYQDRVAEFRDNLLKSQKAKQLMLDQADELQTLSASIYQQHVEGRSHDVRMAQGELSVAAVLALLLGLGASWLITRQIVPPLNRALTVARQIAAGDITGKLDSHTKDEIGQMMGAMQEMAEHLRQLISRIGGGAQRLTSAAAALSVVTSQSNAGATLQREQTAHVTHAVADMVASAQHVAENARDTTHATHVTEQQTIEGNRIIAQALEHFDLLVANVAQCGQAMTRLRHDSERIDGVLGVIRAVAEQTNLLALNAAIEAARAGESGRGFAVVADEVRGLAQRTQQSTQEIEGLILSLQEGAKDATALMQQSEDMSNSSVELARAAGQVLSEIRDSVASIHSMNMSIATAADQQTSVSRQISSSLVRVRDIADESADNSLKTTEASDELSRLSGELTTLVQRFKVS